MPDQKTYTVGWISATKTEYVAAQALLDERHDGPDWVHEDDENSYTLGRIGRHNVALAVLPKGTAGMVSAAITAKDMRLSFPNIKICLMVGIGGGAPSERHDIRLGDVVVSVPSHGPDGNNGGVLQYDYARTIQTRTFQSARYLNQPPRALAAAVHALESKHTLDGAAIQGSIETTLQKFPRLRHEYGRPERRTDKLSPSNVSHPTTEARKRSLPCDEGSCGSFRARLQREEHADDPAVHYGLIASTDTFMEDAEIRDLLTQQKDVLCFEMEAAGLMNNFPCLVIRGICDYADSHWNHIWRGYASMAAATYARDLIHQVIPSRLEAERGIGETVEHINDQINIMQQERLLEKLPIAEGAYFDSFDERKNPTCLENTRVALLELISDWASNNQSKVMFWLNGMAGTGKSTISRTIAQSFADLGYLGASFFFKRGESDRGSADKFFTSLAADMATRHPHLAKLIKDALDKDANVVRKGPLEQFNHLILGPLSAVSSKNVAPQPLVIVVDALDECESDDELRRIISLFSRTKELQVRVFLTSRPELPIRLGFRKVKGSYRDFILHEIPEHIVRGDISLYLGQQLERIRADFNDSVTEEHRKLPATWPSQFKFQALVRMAIPLFIFAATVSRFLSDRRFGNPDGQLKEVLLFQTKSQESQLDATYLPVLTRLVANLTSKRKELILQRFRHVVGTIVILQRPIPILSLEKFLDVSMEEIHSILDLLHSVLDVPSSPERPIRLFHLSFRDFLLDPEKADGQDTKPFWVDGKMTHRMLGFKCIKLMEAHLSFDLLGLEDPGAMVSDIPAETLKQCLPNELRYACSYWALHLSQAGVSISDGDDVHRFLRVHLLHWLEALALMKLTSHALVILKTLHSLLPSDYEGVLDALLEDAVTFVRSGLATIDSTPLQLYSSLLIFEPDQSQIKSTFQQIIPNWIDLRTGTGSKRDSCLQVIKANDEPISAAFSHDLSLFLSLSHHDSELRLWSVESSQCFHILEGHTDQVNTAEFSHDSTLVATASDDQTVKLWDVNAGECLHTLRGHTDGIRLLAMSATSDLVVSGSKDKTIRLWNTDTGVCLLVLEGHTDGIDAIGLSSDSSTVMSGSFDGTVRLWSVQGGETLHSFHAGDGDANSTTLSPDGQWVAVSTPCNLALWDVRNEARVELMTSEDCQVIPAAFSPDSKLLVAMLDDECLHLYDLLTRRSLCRLSGELYFESLPHIAFSPDSKLVAFQSDDDTIRLWSTSTYTCWHVFHGHRSDITGLAFSPRSDFLASSAADGTVRFWKIQEPERTSTEVDNVEEVRDIVFSSAGNFVASLRTGFDLRLWSVATGKCTAVLPSSERPLLNQVLGPTFSPNSSMIVASVGTRIMVWKTGSGELITILDTPGGDGDNLTGIYFAADSVHLAAGTLSGLIHVWHFDTRWQLLRKLQGHSKSITAIAFAHDANLIASASADCTARIWCTGTSNTETILKGHMGGVQSVMFTPDQLHLITSSYDFTIRVWRVDTGECTRMLDPGNNIWFDNMTTSPERELMALASTLGIQIWHLGTYERRAWISTKSLGPIRSFGFEPGSTNLLTNCGSIEVTLTSPYEPGSKGSPCVIMGVALNSDHDWLTWNGKRMLWLPPHFRPGAFSIFGNTIAFSSKSGEIMIVRLAF